MAKPKASPKNRTIPELEVHGSSSVQRTYENRFNCIVCWCPCLKMVYGRCQHKICADCCYDTATGFIVAKNGRCPTCQKDYQFPLLMPIIPEDNIEHQRCLGICSCPNDGCDINLWQWEVEQHLTECPKQPQLTTLKQTKTNSTRKRKSQSPVIDDSPNVQRRMTRSMVKSPQS